MKNAAWMLKHGMKFSELSWAYINGKNIIYYDNHELYEDKNENPAKIITKWLDWEHREPVLDNAERRYLSAVVKPFRNRVEYIVKSTIGCEEYIDIQLIGDSFMLPRFTKGTMYKGMKVNREYTLEELGL